MVNPKDVNLELLELYERQNLVLEILLSMTTQLDFVTAETLKARAQMYTATRPYSNRWMKELVKTASNKVDYLENKLDSLRKDFMNDNEFRTEEVVVTDVTEETGQ